MDRGIIAASNAIYKVPQGFVIGKAPSLDQLRYYSLYWDKVVIPRFDFIPDELQVPQEEGFISAGILERPEIETLAFGAPQREAWVNIMLRSQSQITKDFMQEKDTDWVMQQEGFTLLLPEEYSIECNTLRVDLANCLPVPTGEVNAYDILEFKEYRRDEFLALHEHLDALYEQALLSPDKSLSSKKAISDFTKSIADLDKITHERFKRSRKFDLSTELRISGGQLFAGAAAGSLIGSAIGFVELPIATITGAVLSTIRLSAKVTTTFEPAKNNLKLAYLTNARKENLY